KVTFEVDVTGAGKWTALNTINVPTKRGASHFFLTGDQGEWIRARVDVPAKLSVQFSYTDMESRNDSPNGIFTGLRPISQSAYTGGLLYGLGEDRRALGVAATTVTNGTSRPAGYYELDEHLKLVKKTDDTTDSFIRECFA